MGITVRLPPTIAIHAPSRIVHHKKRSVLSFLLTKIINNSERIIIPIPAIINIFVII